MGGQRVRLVDVSYGGIRVHMPVGIAVHDPLELEIPAVGGRLLATPVWSDLDATAPIRAWLHLEGPEADARRAVVDRLPADA